MSDPTRLIGVVRQRISYSGIITKNSWQELSPIPLKNELLITFRSKVVKNIAIS